MRKSGAENRTRLVAFQQLQRATVIASQFMGDGEAEAGAADRSGKGFEQMLTRLLRQAGSGIGDFKQGAIAVAPASHPDSAARPCAETASTAFFVKFVRMR